MNHKNELSPAIVFDLGGVLMDWSPYYLYCDKLGLDRQTVDHFLKTVDFSGWNREQDRGRTFAEATSELSARFPEFRELIVAYDEHYLDSLSGPILPVVAILEKLKSAGYPLYALSNWPAEKFALVRRQYAFFNWFDGIIISGEVRLIKPDRAIYELTLKRIGRPAPECLFIDDHAPNIQAARALGFQTIQFQSPAQLESELQRLGILSTVSQGCPQV
ncbi:MAG TPA: HAD family phosphatase [Anaerolineaceae bacterium]|nr:HAD family phosphatase [Anaerolineaceae bacterium]HPN51206.1 HAD family phosphatase [Anaerolineaceae bacterium]